MLGFKKVELDQKLYKKLSSDDLVPPPRLSVKRQLSIFANSEDLASTCSTQNEDEEYPEPCQSARLDRQLSNASERFLRCSSSSAKK